MQRYTVYFIWKLLYMYRMVPPPNRQERIQLYLEHLVFVTPLLLPATITAGGSNGVTIPDALETVFALLTMGGGTTRKL
jgi:hypothetical protein